MQVPHKLTEFIRSEQTKTNREIEKIEGIDHEIRHILADILECEEWFKEHEHEIEENCRIP